MIALPLINPSVTELLPERKSQPAPKPTEPSFDRSFKDADARLDKPGPTDQPSRSSQSVPDKQTSDHAVSQTDSQSKAHEDDGLEAQGPGSPDADPQETAQVDQPLETDTPATDQDQAASVEPTVDQGLTVAEVTSVQTPNQVASQILTPDALASGAQTALPQQQAAASQTPVVTDQPASAQADPAVVHKVSGEPAQVSLPFAAQPRQEKPGEAAPTNPGHNGQPSATAQRIEIVGESRQNDSQQADSRDSSQQQNASSHTEALPQQAAVNATGSGLASPGAVGDAAATAAQPSPAPSADHAGTPNPAGPSASQQVTTDNEGNDRINTARITRGLQNAVQQKGGAVTLRLTPPEMGTVRIQLQINNGTVNAQFHAETESTRSLLNQQLSQLRSSLEQQGLTVERLGVQTMQQSSNTNLHHESQSDRDGQPDDGRSRGGFTRQGGDRRQGSDNPQSQQAFDQALNSAA